MSWLNPQSVVAMAYLWHNLSGPGDSIECVLLPDDVFDFDGEAYGLGEITLADINSAIGAELFAGDKRVLRIDLTGLTTAGSGIADAADTDVVWPGTGVMAVPATFTQMFIISTRADDPVATPFLIAHVDNFTPFTVTTTPTSTGQKVGEVTWDNGAHKVYSNTPDPDVGGSGSIGVPTFDLLIAPGPGGGGSECEDGDCVPALSLIVDGVSLTGPAWNIEDLWPLLGDPDYILETLVIPHAEGRVTFRGYIEQTSYDLVLHITGEVDSAGTENADETLGYAANVTELMTSVFTPVSTGDGTKPATLVTPLGAFEFDAKIGPLKPGTGMTPVVMGDGQVRRAANAAFTLTVPAGSPVTTDAAEAVL